METKTSEISRHDLPPALAEVLPWLEPDGDRRRVFQAAVLLAVALHLWLFAIVWPRVAPPAPDRTTGDEIHVLRLENIRFRRPRPPEEIPRPRKKVPGPDLTPDEPEIVERHAIEETPVEWDDQTVLGTVDTVPPPPVGRPAPPKIVDVGQIEAPRVLERVRPAYTRAAIDARIQGAVIVELVIGEQGAVENVRVLRGLPLGLTESAVAAVRRWRFEPSTLDGRPVKVRYRLTVHFELR